MTKQTPTRSGRQRRVVRCAAPWWWTLALLPGIAAAQGGVAPPEPAEAGPSFTQPGLEAPATSPSRMVAPTKAGPGDVTASGTPDTYFIDKTDTFTHLGDWNWTQFTLGSTSTFVLRFASDYVADAAVFAPDQLDEFTNNQGFTGWAVFDNQTGYKTVTLGPGSYYVGARSQTDSSNDMRLELDYQLTLPGYQQLGTFGKAENAADGQTFWLSFTIVSGRRYFIDGVNSGLEVFTVPESEAGNFLSDQPFQYYPDYSGTDTNLPGLWELNLAPGAYRIFFRNRSGKARTFNYLLEWWGLPPLTSPSGAFASAQKKRKIRVSWLDNSNNEGGFTIQRGTSPGALVDYVDVGPNTTSYTFSGLTKGATYYFRVYAWNAQQDSGYSNTTSAKARK